MQTIFRGLWDVHKCKSNLSKGRKGGLNEATDLNLKVLGIRIQHNTKCENDVKTCTYSNQVVLRY